MTHWTCPKCACAGCAACIAVCGKCGEADCENCVGCACDHMQETVDSRMVYAGPAGGSKPVMHFLDACSDPRRILDADGRTTTAYSYKPDLLGEQRDYLYSGIGPAMVGLVVRDLARLGHSIIESTGRDRSRNHRIIGVGIGHDDAEFAETGRSHAAYEESAARWGGPWWEQPGGGAKHFAA